jgi:NAD-dependent SIR2 family protein deacetylase
MRGHTDIACSECHRVTIENPDKIIGLGKGQPTKTGSDYPPHSACIDCHQNFAALALAEAFGETRVQFCAICHNGPPRSLRQPALFDRIPKPGGVTDFGIRFSHEAHRKTLENVVITPVGLNQDDPTKRFKPNEKPDCIDCHTLVKPAVADGLDMSVEKSHSTCFQCHGVVPTSGRKDSDPTKFPYLNDCRECHRVALRNLPPSPRNFDIPRFKHEDHNYEIRPVRKRDFVALTVGQREERLCIECHDTVEKAQTLAEIKLPEPATCDKCHSNRPGLPYKEGIGFPDILERDVLDKLRASRSSQ